MENQHQYKIIRLRPLWANEWDNTTEVPVKCQQLLKTGHFDPECQSKNKDKWARRIGLINENKYTDEENSSSDDYQEVGQISQINKLLPEENDHYAA